MAKGKGTKIAAIVALVAILGSVVGTGILVIVETIMGPKTTQQEITQEQIQELLKNYSGTTVSTGIAISTGVVNSLSGTTLTGTTK